MKTKLMIVLLCSLFVYTAAEAQWTMIPDNNFEQALIDLGIDDVMDGKVLKASVENVTYLDVIDKNISDLSGIEAFIWLNRLEAGGNQLSSINLLNNVRLESLDLRENQLSSIDLTSNLLLKYLILQSNNLTTLNISNNTELEQLFADNNQLTGIDVSQNNKLIYLNIGQNPLNELNISNNFEIQKLFIGFTSISEINVNHLLNLELLYIANTNIEEIVLQNNLKLEELVCSQTPLQNIDVSANLNLKSLILGNTTVSSIDLSYNQKLERFISWYDNIPEIDLSDKPYLDFIFLQYSNVNTLNLTNSENISKIHIEGNFIDSIDLSNFINLNEVVLKSNQLKFLNLKNGYNQSIQNIDLENNPDLTCIQVDDPAWSEANWTQIDPQMYFSEFCGATGDDSDGDGVPDAFDDYPMDETRAFDNYFPAAGYGSLGFEDLWPGMGDYDFNDVVVDYRFHCITNAQNKVVEVKANFVLKASGASLRNGFGFNLPEASQYLQNNLSEVQVSGYHVTEAFVSLMENGFESGQSKPTIIVFDDFFNVMEHPGTGLGINTELDKPFVEFDTLQLAIQPSGLQFGLQDFKFEYWNPFIIVNNERGKEVHLPDYPPTDMADLSIFGTYDDNSNPGTGRYYKTANNLPWAIHVVEEFDWPLEKVSIVEAYRHFFDWAKSAGDEYENWYKDLNGYRDEEKLYIRE